MKDQGKLYDKAYDDKVYGEIGLPDLKIVDGNSETRNKRVLSVGAGMGADLWFLAKKNKVHALDASKVAVDLARKHRLIARVFDVSKKLPYEDGFFDVVVLKDILEHLLEPDKLLKEAKRVMKSSGYMIISLPNHFYFWFRLRILFGKNLLWKTFQHDHSKRQEEWNYMHNRFFTWKGVQKWLKLNELRVEKGYWDLGTLAHYSDPEMFYSVLKNKRVKSRQAKIFLSVIYPTYRVFDFFLPKKIRAWIVSLSPGLLSAGFYLKVGKVK